MKLYIVETESGSIEQGQAMLFDSVWSSHEKAQEYCKRFKTCGAFDTSWPCSITEVNLDESSY